MAALRQGAPGTAPPIQGGPSYLYRAPERPPQATGEEKGSRQRPDAPSEEELWEQLHEEELTSLEQLAELGLITDELGAGDVKGYRYRIERADERTWAGSATPAEVTTGAIFYWIDQSQLIRAELGRPASKDSRIYYDPLQGFTGSMGVQLPDSEVPR